MNDLETAFDSVTELISVQDANYKLIRVNKAYADAFNTKPDKLVGRRCYEVVHGTTCPFKDCPHGQALRTKKPVTREIFEPRLGIYLEVSASPFFNDNGEVAGTVHIAKDVTGRKRMENALKESDANFRDFVMAASDPIQLLDVDGTVRICNETMARAFGLTAAELTGRNVFVGIPPELAAERSALLDQVIKTKQAIHYKEQVGACFYETVVTPIMNPKGEVTKIAVFPHDITDRKRQEDRLAKINACFLKQGRDATENLGRLTALCGELLDGTCALYNRLEGNMLCSLGQWHVPVDYNPQDKPEGHICYDVIQRNPEEVVVIRDLPSSIYARTDPNVTRYGLQTYIGKTVKCGKQPVGSLCVVYQKDFCPTEDDKWIMGIVASAIGMEEERRRMDQALRANEQKFRALVETTSDWIWEVDRNGVYTYASPRVTSLLGYAPEEVLGKTPFDLMPPDEVQRVRGRFEAVVADRSPFANLENVNVHKSGRQVVLETSGVPVVDGKGQWIGYRGIDRDITARKRAEEALRESERNLAITFNSIGDAVIATDSQGCIVRMNRVAEQLTGWPLKEAKGRPLGEVFQIVNQHTRQPVENPVAKVLETGKIQGLANDTLLVSRQGAERIIADSAAAIVDDITGKITGVVLVFRDVTESYALQQQMKIKDQAIETNLYAIGFTDTNEKVSYVNRAFLKMWGYENSREVLGKSIVDFLKDDQELSRFRQTFQRGNYGVGDLMARKKDGTQFPVHIAASAVKDAAGKPICLMASMEDITEVKQAEEEIRKLNASLEQRVTERTAELEAFAYSISHDLRAPLRAIDSFARIMSESHSSHVGKEGHHCLQVIQNNCRQMDRLIQGLLTFSRLSRQPLNKQNVNIQDLVNSVLKDFNAERKERCVKIILGDLPSCEADPVLLRQVLFNLISNALKFTRQQKEAHIEIGSRQKDNQCAYFVKDNGVGFDMQYVHKLFNVFARLHRSEDYEGTGVGLAIVQRIILRHGGRIWIESEVNKGTTVCFTLV